MQIKKVEKVGEVDPKNPWVTINITVEHLGKTHVIEFASGLEDRSFEYNPWPASVLNPEDDDDMEAHEEFDQMVWQHPEVDKIILDEIEKIAPDLAQRMKAH